MSQLGIPVKVENSEISSNLNGTFVAILLMGMYTVIYVGTMYIYLARRASRRIIVLTTTTLLFLSNVTLTGIQWYTTNLQFVVEGGTRDSVFLAIFTVPSGLYIAVNIASYTGFVLADGLLIWRCFHVWNRSFRVISLSLLLLFTETALFFVEIVFHAKFGDKPPEVLTPRFNRALSAGFFMTFSTSVLTTVLIAYRIHSAAKQDGVSKRRFKHIVDIVVQSGVVYSLALLVTAVEGVLPGASDPLDTVLVAFTLYISALANYIAGMSATILVARVSMLAADITYPSTSVHISGLQFEAHSTRRTASREDMEASDFAGVDRNVGAEGEHVEGKVEMEK